MKLYGLSLVLVASLFVHVVLSQAPQTSGDTTTVAKQASYWATVNKKIVPGKTIQLTIHLESTVVGSISLTSTLTFQAYEPNSPVKTLLTSPAQQINPGDTKIINIDVPRDIAMKRDIYGLYMFGIEGKGTNLNFKHEGSVYISENLLSILLSTDKAIYKTGDTVRFRALAINSELKVQHEPMDIIITDPKGNRIKQWNGLVGSQTLGVVQDSLNLASFVLMGEWTLSVTVMQQTETKTFTVAEYVLPRFVASITLPKVCLTTDATYTITVSSQYSFQKPLIYGTADVRLTVYEPWRINTKVYEISTSGKLNKDGILQWVINKKQLQSLLVDSGRSTKLSYNQFYIEANVTEDSTQRVQSTTAIMTVQPYPVQLTVLPISHENFKLGLPCYVFLQLSGVADSGPLPPDEISQYKVIVNVTYQVNKTSTEKTADSTANSNSTDNAGKVSSDFIRPGIWYPYQATETRVLTTEKIVKTFNSQGFLEYSFTLPPEALSGELKATLDRYDVSAYHYISRFYSPSKNYLQLQVTSTATPKVEDLLTLKAVSTEKMKQLNYLAFSKGKLVANGTVTSASTEGETSLNIVITLLRNMIPSVNVFAFYIRKDAEVVPDSMSVAVDGMFFNSPTMRFSKDKVEPGEKFQGYIKAQAKSLVFTNGRDISVETLKNGSDITQDMVRDSVTAQDYGNFYGGARFMFMCGWPWSFGGSDADSVIQSSSLLFFTDGNVTRQPQTFFPMNAMAMEDKGGVEMSTAANGTATSDFIDAVKVRKNFDEIMSFDVYTIPDNADGEKVIDLQATDAITTYVFRLFSVAPDGSLSVGVTYFPVTIFRKIFLTLDLPYSTVQNEILCFHATFFSYYKETIPVIVKFENSNDFSSSFVKRSSDGNGVVMSSENVASADFYSSVSENEVRTSKFCFTKNKPGTATIKVSALTVIKDLSDAVEQTIIVKPEGVTRSNNYPFIVNMTNGRWQKDVPISFPKDTVADSQNILVKIIPNILGNIISNIRDLLQRPYGCGEQNMLNLAPTVCVLEFYYATNTLTPEALQISSDYITTGIMTELTYEHSKTGGFSAFGNSDDSASTWLSCFVVTVFSRASTLDEKYKANIGIDVIKVLLRAIRFIINNINPNGSVSEPGKVFHAEMQGGSSGGEALTAYAIIALKEASYVLRNNATAKSEIDQVLSKMGDYLASRFGQLNDPYSVCIAAYALNKMNHSSKDLFFTKMKTLATTKDDTKFWEQIGTTPEGSSYQWTRKTSAMSIEATSYGLLTFIDRENPLSDWIAILRYLLQNVGPNGGFISTQDTAIGIQAASAAAAMMHNDADFSMTVFVSYVNNKGVSETQSVLVEKADELVQKTLPIPFVNGFPTSLSFVAQTNNGRQGQASVLIDTILSYNVKGETIEEYYSLSHALVMTKTGITLNILLKSMMDQPTSMTILSVEIPSDLVPDIEELKQNPKISRVDNVVAGVLNIYFQSGVIDKTGVSITINMENTGGVVIDPKPRFIVAYDYYNPERVQTQEYTIGSKPICQAIPDTGICPYVIIQSINNI